jgi:hypothetical protein
VIAAGSSSSQWLGWYDGIYATQNACSHFDVVNIHPYTSPGDESPLKSINGTSATQLRYHFGSIPQFIENVRSNAGEAGKSGCDIDKPIWLTEFGWSSWNYKAPAGGDTWHNGVGSDDGTGTDTTLQDDYFIQALDFLKKSAPQVKVAFWYDDHDGYLGGSADAEDKHFGLLSKYTTSGFHEKYVYKALKNYIGSATSTDVTTPNGKQGTTTNKAGTTGSSESDTSDGDTDTGSIWDTAISLLAKDNKSLTKSDKKTLLALILLFIFLFGTFLGFEIPKLMKHFFPQGVKKYLTERKNRIKNKL